MYLHEATSADIYLVTLYFVVLPAYDAYASTRSPSVQCHMSQWIRRMPRSRCSSCTVFTDLSSSLFLRHLGLRSSSCWSSSSRNKEDMCVD